ncbi:MAG TPA: MBL fold metallo-hydrolase, partial [Planctomycetota bacterium]|nr:MBL fold metallo-hydrolase [Planctomycetota bacterium]
MRILALGGASAIGASASLLTAAGRRVLIDAGVRTGVSGAEGCFDLDRLEREGVDGCVLTHAHLDHWGALPRVLQSHKIPVLATRATRDLVLAQARGILARKKAESDIERELPSLRVKDVALLEKAFMVGEFLQPLRPFGPELRITLYPAGHIPGAASILIESREGRLWVSGDYTVRDSIAVPGVLLPLGRIDFAVLDATLGARPAVNRAEEESALVPAVAEALERGGKVLFPVFALGRAQELLILFKRAARRGELGAPIFADGACADLADILSEHPSFLRSEVRRELREERLLQGRLTRVEDRGAALFGAPSV